MRASKLIKRLQYIIDEIGDRDVIVNDRKEDTNEIVYGLNYAIFDIAVEDVINNELHHGIRTTHAIQLLHK